MGTREALPTALPPGLSDLEQQGYKCFLAVMQWHARAPTPTGLQNTPLRSSDIIVTSFPKSGTTMMQQMCYQIAVASGGAPPTDPTGTDFSDFNKVSPWIEFMPEVGVKPCESHPRVFKTHVPLDVYTHPLTAKHIVVMRSPLQFPSSVLDFLFDSVVDWEVNDDVREAAFDATTHGFLLYTEDEGENALSAWHAHVKKNLQLHIDDEKNVLVLCYEDAVADVEGTVRRVARFMGSELSEQGVSQVVKRCDRDYMASQKAFGMISEAQVFESRGKEFMKAKVKRSTGFKRFSVKEKYMDDIRKMNKVALGFEDYEEFRMEIKKKMNRIHGLF